VLLYEIILFASLQWREILNELLVKYKNATIKEKLKDIVRDKIFPPEYFPTDWIKLSIEEIDKFSLVLI